jgi:SAM-dependent methyltransferase
MTTSVDSFADERQRIESEYRRRERDIGADRYAPWRPAVLSERAERLRAAAGLLKASAAFPLAGQPCLEIGYGSSGWLPDLLAWGLRERDLHGIELDPMRAARARALLPVADLRIGDASSLPWADGTFKFVILSTVISSIINPQMRRLVCAEALRVTDPTGVVLFYDLRWNNPSNRGVRKVTRRELLELFPGCNRRCRSVTLAPPLARVLAPRFHLAAEFLATVPLLRTHLMATMRPAAH